MQTLVAFVVVLGVLITAHEFGHYWVARRCGVRVLRFSVGFGKPLLKRVAADGTEWILAAFPLGGYVKMLDERETDVAEHEKHLAFNRQSLLKRSLIVAAGPIANFVLAVLLFWVVFMTGTQELRALISTPKADTPAAWAGFEHGERITSVNGNPIDTWQDFRWQIVRLATEDAEVRIESINLKNEIAVRTIKVTRAAATAETDPAAALGFAFYRPKLPAVVAKVMSGSPAEIGGFKPGDRILALDGKPVGEWQELVDTVRASADKVLEFSVDREGQPIVLKATPRAEEDRGRRTVRIGLQANYDLAPPVESVVEVRYGPFESFSRAVAETWDKSVFTLQAFGRMLTGELSWKNLSGPVTIADYAGQSAKAGLSYYLQFMALVSISLGVLNLLPVPLLDGGHLMYYAVEAIYRRPLSERLQEIGQQIGLALLLGLMAFAFYNDIQRLISG
jgi:regulator of sigma E protease